VKKRLCALILIFVILLAACAPAQDLASIFAPRQPPTLGSWEGNIFTSEHLGLRIDMLDGWVAYTDAELAEFSGFDAALLENRQDFWELTDGMRVTDIDIWNPETFANIMILYEPFYTIADRMMPASQLNEFEAELWFDELNARGDDRHVTVTISDTPVRIGDHYWYYFDTASFFYPEDFTAYTRHFHSVQHGFGMIIFIDYYCSYSETLEEIMSMFSPL